MRGWGAGSGERPAERERAERGSSRPEHRGTARDPPAARRRGRAEPPRGWRGWSGASGDTCRRWAARASPERPSGRRKAKPGEAGGGAERGRGSLGGGGGRGAGPGAGHGAGQGAGQGAGAVGLGGASCPPHRPPVPPPPSSRPFPSAPFSNPSRRAQSAAPTCESLARALSCIETFGNKGSAARSPRPAGNGGEVVAPEKA